MTVLNKRQAGVLLHPTSLPGPYGIGDLGSELIRFLDWLQEAGFSLWQILPLGPTGYGDSPYQCFSAFAGNPWLISPESLVADDLLTKSDIRPPKFPKSTVDYGWVIHWKSGLLQKAFENFEKGNHPDLQKALESFRRKATVKSWLNDYALFMALKDANGGRSWIEWPKDLRTCQEAALKKARREHASAIRYHIFIQFLFYRQWSAVTDAAKERGISIIGDMPIYVAYDSADTWANQELFKLDKDGHPTVVAGVPPDYFSADGQLWGNPIYRWDFVKKQKFDWWIQRVRTMLEQVDVIRLDHFIGFQNYWEVPASHKTAKNGKWIPGPGDDLFVALRDALGDLPLIAENLGAVTEEVEALRHRFRLPGMTILQFSWGVSGTRPLMPNPEGDSLPHAVDKNDVVYTGTHDNPTTKGWWEKDAHPAEKDLLRRYLHTRGEKPHEDMTRAALASPALTAVVPVQDLVGAGEEGRMNFPGRERGNWQWRMAPRRLTKTLAKDLRQKLLIYERERTQNVW